MGNFTVEFAEIVRNSPIYKTYSTQIRLPCTELGTRQRKLGFNNVSIDFNIGDEYNGDTPEILKIISFTDTMTHTEIGTGIVTTPLGFIPDKMMDDSTGLELTYPYEIDISNIDNIHTFNEGTPSVYEFYCSGAKYVARRVRTIEYSISDINGLEGTVEKAYHIIDELP